jgi:hypothetical protein
MQDLKNCIRRYRDVDNEISVLNKTVYNLREKRKIVELEMGDILKMPMFSNYEKLGLEDDGSTIKIQRPGTYSKPWGLSKKDLEENVKLYFAGTAAPNAKDCINFIVEQQKQKLVSADFSFSRTLKNDSMSDA